ncbi:hypothetical protein [Adhaeribacter pallidiroseus]|uniref:Uncharacterized protein n=1 Tax=Adhaeribacter pallidiroseus TaxID=2072847 RepID=A0A369QGV6_9BACT|nr:hypothetical protein [Adhaeribacter pallidiroseus]RDC63662.1 hypothetical protein AHMF7616_02267 [Adhaeribacter pallidiroseus]
MKRTWEPVEELNKYQIEMAINYLDKRIDEEPDKAKVMEYCVMKIDLMNELMLLDNNSHWII